MKGVMVALNTGIIMKTDTEMIMAVIAVITMEDGTKLYYLDTISPLPPHWAWIAMEISGRYWKKKARKAISYAGLVDATGSLRIVIWW
jgi:uncharacterized membrane protein (GlpM family)